jgi:hypothetical protein
MASSVLDQQLPGQRFTDIINTANTGFAGVPNPITPNTQSNTFNSGPANVGSPAPVSQSTIGGPSADPQMRSNVASQNGGNRASQIGGSVATQIGGSVASQNGQGSNTLMQLPRVDPVPANTGLAQTQGNPNIPSLAQSGRGVSHFGNNMVHSQPIQANSPKVNLHTGVHSKFNPFVQNSQKPPQSPSNVGSPGNVAELPVMGQVGGMELPVLQPPSNGGLKVNPFEPNPAPVRQGSVGIGPQPIPYTPSPNPSTKIPQPSKPQAPSIISNLNIPGKNQAAAGGNFFSWRQQPQNSFSIKRQKRSVQNKIPSPLDNECTSWIHQMARPIQNTFEIDGVADSSKWLYVPVSVKLVRSPNRTYEIYGYRNGANSMYDIYDPQQSTTFQRRVNTQALPHRSHSSISGSGASHIYLKSDGLSYEASYIDYVVVDERMPISEYTGFVAIKNPEFGRSETHISVFDSLGELCKPRCATSKSRSNPRYRPCSGIIRADTSSPDMAFKTIPEALLSMYSIKDPYPPRMYRPPYIEFLCESTNTLYWEGCENNRYQ